jgi:hypothetical protein
LWSARYAPFERAFDLGEFERSLSRRLGRLCRVGFIELNTASVDLYAVFVVGNGRSRWLGSRHRIDGKPILGEVTTDARKKWSKAPCTLSLFAITRGELFEIVAIVKERYRVETFCNAKKVARGSPAICTRRMRRKAIPVVKDD